MSRRHGGSALLFQSMNNRIKSNTNQIQAAGHQLQSKVVAIDWRQQHPPCNPIRAPTLQRRNGLNQAENWTQHRRLRLEPPHRITRSRNANIGRLTALVQS